LFSLLLICCSMIQ